MERDSGAAGQVPAPAARARVGILDLLQLGAALGADRLRGKRADPGATGTRWATGVMERRGSADLDFALPGLDLALVGNREHSDRVLAGRPGDGPDSYEAGRAKVAAMRFLAPGALTIANGDTWRRLRQFNEHVLGTGSLHPLAPAFLRHVRAAFERPMRDDADIRAAMGRAMTRIVVGEVSASDDPAGDVSTLFAVVQSPIRRLLFGFLYRRRRERLYDLLGRTWDRAAAASAADATLVGFARQSVPEPALDRDTLLQQIPHWMFTFTGSGTDLLTRTLYLVGSRPDVRERVLDEIRGAGPPDRADAVARLVYLEACFRETGRLFPPVTRTFHHRPAIGQSRGQELAHYFPLLQRDDRLGPTVHEFRPERWMTQPDAGLDAPASASNLFLRGPRACPGMNLVLFVCKVAAARQLGELGLRANDERLARDPLPISFPTPGPFTVESRVGMRSTLPRES
jgi:cytochrome P450